MTATISPAIQVTIHDAQGNVETASTDSITVRMGTNPRGATLSGTTTAAAVSGVATFSDLKIDKAGIGYTLTAAGTGFSTATSNAFNVFTPLTAMSAGRYHTCGLIGGGATYCWGDNSEGQVGDFSTNETEPVAVFGVPALVSLSAGAGHTCGLTSAGAAYCWGLNTNGELGDSGATSAVIAVPGGHTFTSITAGLSHTCGLTSNGAAYCWGQNAYGQLGTGATSGDSAAPATVTGGLAFTSVTAGGLHTCGLTAAGVAYCWGYNGQGALGSGSFGGTVTAPAVVAGGLVFAKLVASAPVNLDDRTCGLTSGGNAYCWGSNSAGELGDGSTANRSSPVAVLGGLTFQSIGMGTDHACGLTLGGAVYCWGYNGDGQLGDGTTINRSAPVAAASGFTFVSLIVGGYHTCGLTPDGSAWCWGYDGDGELGDGSSTNTTSPVRVQGPVFQAPATTVQATISNSGRGMR
ncbi:MAG TPA: hypothetical protein VGI92_10450 [Gemmatimonadales bacterium]|jgi:alpha-tubulin suppressor-like RCC1 family protein